MVNIPESFARRSPGFHIDPAKALVAAAICWAGFAAVTWAVTTGNTAMIDDAGLLFWRDGDLRPMGTPRVLEMVRDITALGGILLRSLFALGAVAALMFLNMKREAALFALTVGSGWIMNGVLKLIMGRERPEIVPHLTEAGGASFPSGHSFGSALVYIAMALAFAALSRRQSVRLTIVGSAILASLVISWSRVWLGVHWPSDVIAGWLGGAGWAFFASALLNRPAAHPAELLAAGH